MGGETPGKWFLMFGWKNALQPWEDPEAYTVGWGCPTFPSPMSSPSLVRVHPVACEDLRDFALL